MKLINREEICSACLEYQSQVIQISDDYIKQLYKSFANDYQNDERLYLCYYCRHTFTKISSFKTMCLQSYLFLAKYRHLSKLDRDQLAELKTLIQNNTGSSSSEINQISLPHDDNSNDPLSSFKFKKEEVEDTTFANIKIKEEIDFDDHLSSNAIDDVEFKEETKKPTKVETSNNTNIELPIEFEKETIKKRKEARNKKSMKGKTPEEIKKSVETANLLQNMIEINLSQQDQIRELEEIRKSEKYVQAFYKCDDCAQTFELGISLEKHLKKHDKSRGSFECWLCHMRFSVKDTMKAHTYLHSTRLLCKLCNYESRNRHIMKDHLEGHTGANRTCHICDKVFKLRCDLLKHLKTHKNENKTRNFKCEQCDLAFFTKGVLQRHEYIHRDIRPYTCETCGKTFKTKNSLKLHTVTHLEKSDEFYCVECDVSFKSQSQLKYHLDNTLKHTDSSLLKFPCELCPKKYKSQEMLNSHIQSSHEKIPKFSCDVCGGLYVTQQGLNFHKRKAHQGYVKPLKYACPTCNKCFDAKALLENHIRTHTGERPFQCDLCDWKFTQKASLRTHIKLKHLKIKRSPVTKK